MEYQLQENSLALMRRLLDGTFEIRILENGQYKTVWSCLRDDLTKDWDQTRRRLLELNKTSNVFFTMNPLLPACKSKTAYGSSFTRVSGGEGISDNEIAKYRWLLIDLDPDRPKDVSSTDEEKALAYTKAIEIRQFLSEKGLLPPVFCDSGNGFHLLYRVSLENSKENANLLRDVLLSLSEKFSDEHVKVDRKVFNPARIIKFYGTMSRKGRDDAENGRPHRKSGFIEFPDLAEIKVNDRELLVSLVGPKPEREKTSFGAGQSESIDSVRGFMDRHDIPFREEDRHGVHYFYLENGCSFDERHKGKDACVIVGVEGNKAYKCFHDSCEGKHWRDFVRLYEPEYKTYEERRAEEADLMREMFGEEVEDPEIPASPIAPGQLVDVQRSEKGKALPTIANFRKILKDDPVLKGVIGFNELSQMAQNRKTGKDWKEADDARVMNYIESVYGMMKKEAFAHAMAIHIDESRFHPVKDLLDSLVWDGQPRLATCLTDYLGAEDSEYTRFLARMMFVAAVKRVYEPGCKYDNMVVLVGPQGCGKSTFCERMALKEEFFTDSIRGIGSKEAIEQLLGAWIVEWGEMSAMRRAKDAECLKLFITQKVDKFRNAFGRYVLRIPRSCVFVGTSNDTEGLLTDRTGNRRFFPVEVSDGPKSLVSDTVKFEFKQLYAEAIVLYRGGQSLTVPKSLYDTVACAQERYLVEDPREGIIHSWITSQEDLDKVCTRLVWDEALDLRGKEMTRKDSIEIGRILSNLSCLKKTSPRIFERYGNQKAWLRVHDASPFDV